jgi:type II secretory pathway pseudopilin PulG
MRSHPRVGFSMLEMLVVVGVITVLAGILIPAVGAAREVSHRSGCGSTLRSIAADFSMYASSNNSQYPTVLPPPSVYGDDAGAWTPLSPTAPSIETAITVSYTAGSMTPGSPTANAWLLVLSGLEQPKGFICPSDPRGVQPSYLYTTPAFSPTPEVFSDFGALIDSGGTELGMSTGFSYSFAYPWYADYTPQQPWWRDTGNSQLALACDMAPSYSPPLNDPTAAPGTPASNSKNHNGVGQNIVFGDAHVEFSKTNRVGPQMDNIFEFGNSPMQPQDPDACTMTMNDPSQLQQNDADKPDVLMVPAYP